MVTYVVFCRVSRISLLWSLQNYSYFPRRKKQFQLVYVLLEKHKRFMKIGQQRNLGDQQRAQRSKVCGCQIEYMYIC